MLVNGLVSSEGLGAEVEINEMDFPSLYVANTLSASLQSVVAANSGGTSCLQLATVEAALVSSVSAKPVFTIRNTNGDGNGVSLVFDKFSASPQDNEILGEIKFVGRDAGNNQEEYARISSVPNDVSIGAESGRLDFYAMNDDGTPNLDLFMQILGADDGVGNDGGVFMLKPVRIAPTTTGTMLDFQLETEWTGGTLINADFGSATTATDDIFGFTMDLSTNFTMLTNKDVTGFRYKAPALTQSAANTTNLRGFNFYSPGALVQNTGAGTIDWDAITIAMPALTQTTGTVTVDAIHIVPGSYTSGTERGIYFASDPNDGAIVSAAGLTMVSTGFVMTGGAGGVRVDNTLGIGVAPSGNSSIFTDRTFTATAVGASCVLSDQITGFAGSNMYGISIGGSRTPAASGTHTIAASVYVPAFDYGADTGATIGNLAGIYVNPPAYAGTVTNGPYSIFVDAGDCRFDGDVKAATVTADNGVASFTGNPANITIVNGIVTSATS